MNIETEGLKALFTALTDALLNLDLRKIDLDYLPTLLTWFYPLWNPIWQAVSAFLGRFGF